MATVIPFRQKPAGPKKYPPLGVCMSCEHMSGCVEPCDGEARAERIENFNASLGPSFAFLAVNDDEGDAA